MSSPRAILVDDDPQQRLEATGSLSEAGFEVLAFDDTQSILNFLDGPTEFIDLFVLDRKLPMKAGDPAFDELGDGLFKRVRREYPDARVLVFSGYTDFEHAQELMQNTGLLYEFGEIRVDVVSVLRKTQFDRFEEHIAALRSVISSFDNIEIVADGVDLNALDKRVLRRIGQHYSASSLHASPLAGGLTGARVWRCEIIGPDGKVARVVAKQEKSVAHPGGLQDLLNSDQVARRVESITGLMNARIVSVLQLAGERPTSLLSMLPSDDAAAANHVTAVANALDALERSPTVTIRLSEVSAALVDWSKVESRLVANGVPVPAGDMWVSTTKVWSHCDLHPANVLICDGRAVLIDSDGNTYASSLVDPVYLLLSTLVHPDSPIAGAHWLTKDEIIASYGHADFGSTSSCPQWFASVQRWISIRQISEREFWAVTLGFVSRQLGYDDVLSDSHMLERVLALATKASERLLNS